MAIKKPPLGIMPHDVWVALRIVDICEAMERYIEAEEPIPISWVNELKSLAAPMGYNIQFIQKSNTKIDP